MSSQAFSGPVARCMVATSRASDGSVVTGGLIRRRGRSVGILSMALSLGAGAVLFAGCGGGRSVAAYCHVFYTTGAKLRAAYSSTSNNLLTDLGKVFGAPAQLADFFTRLDAVAPTTIEPQVATLAHAFRSEVDSEGNDLIDPIGGVLGGLADGLASEQAYEAVTHWTLQHCGPPPGASS